MSDSPDASPETQTSPETKAGPPSPTAAGATARSALASPAAPLLARAAQLHKAGDLPAAVQTYRQAIVVDPGFAEAHNNLGAALRAWGKRNEAIVAYQEALALAPDYALAHANLGGALAESGETEAALDHLAAGYLLAPDRPQMGRRLVNVLRRSTPASVTPRVHEALAALVEDPAVEPQSLEPCIVALLNADPRIRGVLDALAAGQPPTVAEAGPPVYAAIAESELPALLAEAVLTDSRLEMLFAILRAAWLEALLEDHPELLPDRALLVALGLQLETVEWSWLESPAEQQRLAGLAERLRDPAARRDGPDAPGAASLALLVYALYRPLDPFYEDAELHALADPAAGPEGLLLYRHLVEPAERERFAAAIPGATPIRDRTSQSVRAMYEVNAYPRWRRLARRPGRRVDLLMPELLPDLRRVSIPFDQRRVRILVAGCGTGRHACMTAQRFAFSQVVAVDLSRRSLSYAAQRARDLELRNLHFLQGDILELGGLGEEFDIIECSGVLHHLASPEQGWRVLCGLLAPGGLMRIALYSDLARQGVEEARAVIREQGLTPTPDGIRAARAAIRALPEDSQARLLAESPDFFSLSGCRDLFFHVREDRFTVPRIAHALEALQLDFLGFELPSEGIRYNYRRRFPEDPEQRDLAKWATFEEENYLTFAAMYQFWCQAKG
ncbi:TPR repeat-containing protein [Tistlia consotensis]|uniref:TPR repeat-containing protein n=1 Tax=Tistlia consotensis USBA 355 TaxID=560819 RepID=A0A1Y6C3G6_9PROT|nr:methyltransferase domain-containing protein [Tistlia consotensis]SMF41169.1 TPR repeat-containing protein [Tistlia consotensis USBA 355]SNR73972.1 TPR repeat-containing protein [Tistlia consotensis]